MDIKNHLLFLNNGQQADFVPTPNKGGKYTPRFVVIHYTAATSALSAINWFKRPEAQASAHLVIDADGAITQFAPFNVVTWHAGRSQWRGVLGLNQHAIGIELVNGGRLVRNGDKWTCPVDRCVIRNDDVLMAVHRNETAQCGWQEYSSKQLEVAVEVTTLLVKTYGLEDVLGHDDISPLRKSDPGPAFPMGSFRSKAMGRKDDTMDELVTIDKLNIRSGPGTAYPPLVAPLPKGTPVVVMRTEGNWSFVDVQKTVGGVMDLEGWVSSKFLVKA